MTVMSAVFSVSIMFLKIFNQLIFNDSAPDKKAPRTLLYVWLTSAVHNRSNAVLLLSNHIKSLSFRDYKNEGEL